MAGSGRCKPLAVLAVLTLVVGIIVLLGTMFLPLTPSVFATLRSYGQASSDAPAITAAAKASAKRGFILPISVDQQLTGGLKGFTQLSMIGAMLNLSTVEPYVHGTRLVGVPNIADSKKAPFVLKLSNLYDFEDLKRNFKKCSAYNDHQLSSFETFVNTGSRQIILVYFVTDNKEYTTFFHGSRGDKVIEVKRNVSPQVIRLNKWVKYFLQENWNNNKVFRAAHTVLIDARPTVALPFKLLIEKMKVILENHMLEFGSVTVLVDNWRAITSNAPMGKYYYITGFKWRPCGTIDYIKHSATVYNASLLFTQNLNDSKASVIDQVICFKQCITMY